MRTSDRLLRDADRIDRQKREMPGEPQQLPHADDSGCNGKGDNPCDSCWMKDACLYPCDERRAWGWCPGEIGGGRKQA